MKRIAVVELRGQVKSPVTIKDTLKKLRLTRVNHCVVIDDRDTYKGMLKKVKDMTTYGEITPELMKELMIKRGRFSGDKRFSEELLRENSEYKTLDEFLKAYFEFKAELDDIEGLKKVFRLSPPSKGLKSKKKPVNAGGDLGQRDIEGMKALLMRMI